MSLAFTVDRKGEEHIVTVYKKLDGSEEPVADVAPLFHYGYQEEVLTDDGDLAIYVLDQQDQQTLFALRSMNPRIGEDGSLAFPFAPPMLDYLRAKGGIEESESSRRLTIRQEKLSPSAEIDFSPAKGMTIRTGYRTPEARQLIPGEELPVTADGNHVLVGDTFLPSPKELSALGQAWLKRPQYRVPMHDVPKFLQRYLASLEKEFSVEISDLAGRVRVDHEPLRPTAEIDFDPAEGLTIQTGYRMEDSDRLVSDPELRGAAHGDHVLVDDTTFVPLPKDLSPKGQEWLRAVRNQVPLHQVPGFLQHDMLQLKTEFEPELSEIADQIRISEKPLRPIAEIDFDPAEGLTIQTGYQIKPEEPLIPEAKLWEKTYGNHVLVDDTTFVPFPSDLSATAKSWLRQPRHHVPVHGIPEFFQRDLVLLKKDFTAVLTDLAGQIRIIEEPFKPVVSVDKDDRGWLDFDVGYEAGGVRLPHGLLAQNRGKPYIQLDDMTWVKNDPRAVSRTERELRDLGAEIAAHGFRTPVSQFASLDDFVQSIGGTTELSAAYRAFLDQLTGFDANEQYRLSRSAEERLSQVGIILRPYQRAGIHWLLWLYDNYLHGLLADDLGLGKTVQAILLLRQAYLKSFTRQHTLVLAPKSVMHHWVRELERFYPEIRVYPYHGSGRRHDLFRAVEPIVFISTYATATNDIDVLGKVPFFYVILDEATRIKNPQAKRTQTVKALNSAHRIALSGIPVENRPAEIWSIFDFLMRGHLGRHGTFQRVFEKPISAGDRNAREQLGQRIRPFTLRRLKEDVAKDLPEKIELDEWCELTTEQRKLYGGLQGDTKRLRAALQRGEQVNYTTSILPILTKLKQICDHPALVSERKEPIYGRSEKFDWIVATIDEILASKDQVVVFSHFLGMLDLLEKNLLKKHISYMRIDGSTRNRQELIDRFNDGRADVALCSIMAAGYGVNLTSGNHVIHADRWWNPAVEDQATDRVHRIGQNKTVYVHRILVEGTLEERIDTLLTNKRHMAGQIMDAAAKGVQAWTREELLELLRPLDATGQRTQTYDRIPGQRSERRHQPQVATDAKPSQPAAAAPPVARKSDVLRAEPLPITRPSEPTRPPSVSGEIPYSERLKQVMALGRDESSAIRDLVAFLADEDQNLRWLAGSSLVQRANSDVVNSLRWFLEEAASDKVERARAEAMRVLKMIAETTEDETIRKSAYDIIRSG